MAHQNQGRIEHDRTDIDYREGAKKRAQLKNIDAWKSCSGRTMLDPNEGYWTLMDDRSFELETLEEAKFISSRSQFHGINDNERKYKACLERFPGINVHFGEWTTIMRQQDVCPMGLVYLDTMTQLDEQSAVASTMLAATLAACGSKTLVCANFCLTNPRQGRTIKSNIFAERLLAYTEEVQEKWALVVSPEEYDCYLPEKTRATQMITYFFWRAI